MPLKFAPEDRNVVIAIGVLMALALLAALFAIRSDAGSGALPSSYSAGNDGTKAAFLLLEQMGYAPVRWTSDPSRLAELRPGATLILAEPMITDQRHVEALRRFVRDGGRVIVTGWSFAAVAPPGHFRPGVPHFQWKAYRPHEPSDLTRGIDAIALAPQFYFNPETSEAPFADGDEVPVTRFSYGAGEVIWWASFAPMSNSGIRERDNAQLLLNCAGLPGRGPVLWDEYFHQGGRTVIDSVLASPLKWGLLQALAIAASACFTYSRRFGPARQSIAAPRLAPIEFVETLAALYQHSGKAHMTVEIVYEHFRGALQRRFAVPTGADAEQVADGIADHLPGEDAAEIARLLHRVEAGARDASLRPAEAVALVSAIHELGTRLKLKPGREA